MHKFIVRSFSARWTSARKSITQSDSRFHPNVFILYPVTGKSLSTVSNTQSVIRLIDPIYESAVWMEWQVTFNSLKLVSLHPSEPFHLKHSTFACVCLWLLQMLSSIFLQGDLHSYVRVRKRLREPEAKRLFRQMCEVVKSCHEQGIVLRDLKLRKFVFADAER